MSTNECILHFDLVPKLCSDANSAWCCMVYRVRALWRPLLPVGCKVVCVVYVAPFYFHNVRVPLGYECIESSSLYCVWEGSLFAILNTTVQMSVYMRSSSSRRNLTEYTYNCEASLQVRKRVLEVFCECVYLCNNLSR